METIHRADPRPGSSTDSLHLDDAAADGAAGPDAGIARYLREVGRCRLLTRAEEKELLERIRLRDRAALHALVNAHLKWVIAVSAEYQGRGLPMAELIAEGNLALIRAALSFNPAHAFRFTAYAIWWIRKSLERALEAQVRFRAPLPGGAGFAAPSTPDAPVTSTRPPVQEVAGLHRKAASRSPTAPSAPRTSGQARAQDVLGALETLREPGRTILKLFFGMQTRRPLTLEEIARLLGLEPDRARQLKDLALRRLQRAFPEAGAGGSFPSAGA